MSLNIEKRTANWQCAFPLYVRFLLWCDTVKETCDYRKHQIREPEGDCRWQCVGVHEHLAESQEEDVGEGQGYTGSDVPSDSSPSLL